MRIRQLSLIRYGKFTDKVLELPGASRDFHLIVGANEAGKSTTRSAILDLLFGIEARSTYDFLHAKADMRLGATIEHLGQSLDFVRTKARSRSLFGPAGAALAESALAPFLARSDRAFFDQMFGLDHARLVAGGNDILSASNDIGQILFQSAAGIGSLGVVRDQLEAEADKLWARRRSGERAYYVASDELARAEAALKSATVRSKDWLEARGRVQELEERRERLRERHRRLETERNRLERVRRVASALRQLRDQQAELRQLGDAVLLPHDAARQMAESELELAGAERDAELHAGQADAAREQREQIRLDQRVLDREADILALAKRHQQLRHHERDIDRCRLEVGLHWQQVEALVRQLGWPAAAEDVLADRLPALPARSAVSSLARRHGVLELVRQTASAALDEKLAESAALQAELESLSVSTVPTALRAALAAARALGDTNAGIRRAAALVEKTRRELASAVAGLGRCADLKMLRALNLPSVADIQQRQKRQTDAAMLHQAQIDRHHDIVADIDARELEIAQYRHAHDPVSLDELREARARRDAVWRDIKAGAIPTADAAEQFESRLGAADDLSDRRHDKAREASELQARLDALQRLQQQATGNAARQAANDAELAALGHDWDVLSAALGLAGLALQDVEPWRAARDLALRAADASADAQLDLAALRQTVGQSAASLGAALGAAGVSFEPEAAFETLLLVASDAVDAATATRTRFDELHKRIRTAASALQRQCEKAGTAQAGIDGWSAAWRAATVGVGLPETIDVASAEVALALLAEIDTRLGSIRELRKNRIEAMQRDLCDFEHEVALAATAAASDLVGQGAGAAVLELAARLAKTLDERREADRLSRTLATHEAHAETASAKVALARARLGPLLHLAGVCSHDELRDPIARSDRRRLVEAESVKARQALDEGGDGLSVDALEAEVAATDTGQIPALIADLASQIDAVRHEQDTQTADLTHAASQLARINGQDDAARAESERQDALARMANAAERYIKVYTASRLLKWAIDRYRETRQGPMLMRAGEIFSALTLGSFSRLTVDFDSEPLALHGVRAVGGLVGIRGMSDGTRDQLYLALRLAALELHLGHGHALPFIADDLFVNYDDRRARAGLEALGQLSELTQVIFLSHHDHLVPTVRAVFGEGVNVSRL